MRIRAGVAHDQSALGERLEPASDPLPILANALERVSAGEVGIDGEASVSCVARQSVPAECCDETRLGSARSTGSSRAHCDVRSISIAQCVQHDLTHGRKLVYVLVPIQKVGRSAEQILEAVELPPQPIA